ncbi:MAG: DUF853 family protein [Lachnospiraceae bacterium]|nr:DUF853 family protein [Lachnospiraceae bacterium]
MFYNNKVLMAKNNDKEFYLLLNMVNKHGLIAGGTGSGKTITLKVMAESFADAGVPVFLADVKGDLAGMCEIGIDSDDMKKRIEKFKLNDYGFSYKKYTTQFFEINRKYGLPVRTTISNFGPTLLSHIFELNQTQSDVLNVIFKIADDEGLPLLDLKDLKKILEYVSEHNKDFSGSYGNITKPTLQSILRAMISLEQEGIDMLFGEPEIELSDLIKTDSNGKGIINILHSQSLILSPRVYSAFMLWFISELYETMPEVGDLDKPKFVFFFDEAHILFKDCSTALLKKIDQITKLIRSKGIGLFFITQDPTDIPDTILQQLGNKVQHVHRSYTAKDKRNHKAICDSFRDNKDLDISEILETLGTGEALVSFLDEKGAPNIVDFAKILPPQSKMGTIDDNKRQQEIKSSMIYTKYINDLDRESAYELLSKKIEQLNESNENDKVLNEKLKEIEKKEKIEQKENDKLLKEQMKREAATKKKISSAFSNVIKTTGSTIGREVSKSLTDAIFGSKSKTAKRMASNIGSSIGRNLLGTLLKG